MAKKPISPVPEGTLRPLPGGSLFRKTLLWSILLLTISVFILGVTTSNFILGFIQNFVSPTLSFFLIIIGAVIFCIGMFFLDRAVDNMILGLRGERATALELDRLGRDEWHVFHDLQKGKGEGNIDHIVLCPKGIFSIETKAWTKSRREKRKTASNTISYDGRNIYKNEKDCGEDAPLQAELNAKDLRKLLNSHAPISVPRVHPILTFPGWWVKTTESGQKSDLTVCNPKQIHAIIRPMKDTLSRLQIEKLAAAMEKIYKEEDAS